MQIDLSSLDLILFDFDGLLVDTEEVHFEAYKNMLRKRGHHLAWSFKKYCAAAHMDSDGLSIAIYHEFPSLKSIDWEILRKEKQKFYQQLIQEGNLSFMPGASKLLKMLQEKEILHGVVTNSTFHQIEEIKKHLPLLKKIPFWITRDDISHPKPSPESYLLAKKRFAKENDHILGFEDSLKGIEALHGAGIPSILICPEGHPQLDHPLPPSVQGRFDSLERI